jgi:hypothetical protein
MEAYSEISFAVLSNKISGFNFSRKRLEMEFWIISWKKTSLSDGPKAQTMCSHRIMIILEIAKTNSVWYKFILLIHFKCIYSNTIHIKLIS